MADTGTADSSWRALGPLIAAFLAAVAGFAVWTSISLLSGQGRDGVFVAREAWDSPAYFSIGLPVYVVATGVAGFLAPRRVWRWPLWLAVGQAVGMAVVHPPGTDLGLIPLGLLFVGLPLVIALSIPALAGGVVARRGWDAELIA